MRDHEGIFQVRKLLTKAAERKNAVDQCKGKSEGWVITILIENQTAREGRKYISA